MQGLTALMYATMAGHIKVIKELLLAKADPTLRGRVSTCCYSSGYGDSDLHASFEHNTSLCIHVS